MSESEANVAGGASRHAGSVRNVVIAAHATHIQIGVGSDVVIGAEGTQIRLGAGSEGGGGAGSGSQPDVKNAVGGAIDGAVEEAVQVAVGGSVQVSVEGAVQVEGVIHVGGAVGGLAGARVEGALQIGRAVGGFAGVGEARGFGADGAVRVGGPAGAGGSGGVRAEGAVQVGGPAGAGGNGGVGDVGSFEGVGGVKGAGGDASGRSESGLQNLLRKVVEPGADLDLEGTGVTSHIRMQQEVFVYSPPLQIHQELLKKVAAKTRRLDRFLRDQAAVKVAKRGGTLNKYFQSSRNTLSTAPLNWSAVEKNLDTTAAASVEDTVLVSVTPRRSNPAVRLVQVESDGKGKQPLIPAPLLAKRKKVLASTSAAAPPVQVLSEEENNDSSESDVECIPPAPKRQTRQYDKNRRYHCEWSARFPWAEGVDEGGVHFVKCIICSTIEGKSKLLAAKTDTLIKHEGYRKALKDGAVKGVKKG